jgi:aspartyl-tRNA(Asn)/glutamyl-tRNA(Gln) amidotransferase subunit B
MEDGAFRADTNISVRKKGAHKLGTRCELKNINSFKFICDAIEYEIERQIMLVESGEKVRQETRLWDTKDHKTVLMRSKEEAADYRYLTDPDLPLLLIDTAWIERIQKTMPELPYHCFNRLIATYEISPQEADILLEDLPLLRYFEAAYACHKSKSLINWVVRDLMGYLKEHKIPLAQCKITPEKLASLVALLETGRINNHAAKQVFDEVAIHGQEPADVVKNAGLEQIDSQDALEANILEVLAAHPNVVAEYKAGKDKLFGFFVGQVMQKTKGKGNPVLIQELLKKQLR